MLNIKSLGQKLFAKDLNQQIIVLNKRINMQFYAYFFSKFVSKNIKYDLIL